MTKKNLPDLVKRYEQKLQTGKSVYFDADEFDELAEYFDAHDDIESAREVVEDGLAIHPESNSLQLKKSRFLVYDVEYTTAIRLLEKYFPKYEYDPNMLKAECYLQLGMFTEAYITVKAILEHENDDLGVILAEIGFLYVEADLFDEAVLYFNKSLGYELEKPEDVLSDLAYAYEMLGDYDSAIETTNKILDIDSYTYDAWINLGKLYSLQDNFEKAVEAFDFALTITESDTNIIKLKAHCLSLCGKTEEAAALFRDLLIDRPYDTSIYFLLAECYQTMGKNDEALTCLLEYSDAINSVSRETASSIDDANLDTAYEIVKQSLKDNDSPALNMIAGDILFKQKQFKEAEEYFLKALTIDNDDVTILDRLAIVAIRKEDYSSAINYTTRILELMPDNHVAKLRLTLLYFEENDPTGFDRLVEQLPDNELHELFNLIYSRKTNSTLTREQLVDALRKARDCRMLFGNLRY